MRKLTVEVLAGPKTLADWCRRYGNIACGKSGCCPFPATACPLDRHVSPECRAVTPEHWEEVLNWKEEEDDGQEV